MSLVDDSKTQKKALEIALEDKETSNSNTMEVSSQISNSSSSLLINSESNIYCSNNSVNNERIFNNTAATG